MKKILLALALLAAVAAPVFSLEVSFQHLSCDPLFKDNPADPYGFSSDIHAVYLPFEDDRELEFIVYHDDGTGTALETTPVRIKGYEGGKELYLKGRFDICRSIAITTLDFGDAFPTVTADINLKAGLNACFEGSGGADILSYDGMFFIGPEATVGNFLAFRMGLHHMSGHYGDEVLKEFENANNVRMNTEAGDTIDIDGATYTYYGLAQYVRDNCFLFGVQGNLPLGFTVYAELSVPFHTSFVRPFFECPSDHSTTTADGDDASAWHDLAASEGVGCASDNADYRQQLLDVMDGFDSSYRAWRIHWGAMWSIRVGIVGLSVEIDVQAHQDGQTLHTLGGYDKDNPWEFEVTGGFGVEVFDIGDNHSLGVELQYHEGRFPALNLLNNRVRYVCIGLWLR